MYDTLIVTCTQQAMWMILDSSLFCLQWLLLPFTFSVIKHKPLIRQARLQGTPHHPAVVEAAVDMVGVLLNQAVLQTHARAAQLQVERHWW